MKVRNQPTGQQQMLPTMTYVDRPEISETFADSCARMTVEGFNGKLEFVVNRMNDPQPPAPPAGRALTALRLVLPLPGILDLHAKLTQLIGALQAQGAITQISQAPQSGRAN
jgi:hypothetical protein